MPRLDAAPHTAPPAAPPPGPRHARDALDLLREVAGDLAFVRASAGLPARTVVRGRHRPS